MHSLCKHMAVLSVTELSLEQVTYFSSPKERIPIAKSGIVSFMEQEDGQLVTNLKGSEEELPSDPCAGKAHWTSGEMMVREVKI